MRKNYLKLASITTMLSVGFGAAVAQTTIPADSANYVIGENTTIQEISNASSFSAGSEGSAIVWDFSGLAAGTQRDMNVEAVVTGGLTPDPVDAAVKLVIDRPISDETYFYDPSSSGLGYAGQSWGVNTLNYENNNVLQWSYPITYQDSSSYAVSNTYTTGVGPTAVDHTIEGNVSYKVDAYGRIKMPYGDVYEVLRIKITEMVTDTADVPIVGNQVFNYDNVMYEWRSASNKHFIIRFDRKKEGSSTQRRVYYQTGDSVNGGTQPTNVELLVPEMPDFMVYPNPAFDQLSISYKSMDTEHFTSARILDLSGRVIREFPVGSAAGKAHVESFDVSDLPSGNYLIDLSSNERRLQKRIVIH